MYNVITAYDARCMIKSGPIRAQSRGFDQLKVWFHQRAIGILPGIPFVLLFYVGRDWVIRAHPREITFVLRHILASSLQTIMTASIAWQLNTERHCLTRRRL